MAVSTPLPRNTPIGDRKRAYDARLRFNQERLLNLDGAMVEELRRFFQNVAQETAAIISKDYQAEFAATRAASTIKSLESSVGKAVDDLWADYSKSLNAALAEAGAIGQTATDDVIAVGSSSVIKGGLTTARNNQLLLMQNFSADLIRNVKADVIRNVNTILRSGVGGAISPSDMMTRIRKFIPVEGTRWEQFAKPDLLRAEAIVRTEMGRVNSLATELRGQEYQARGLKVLKTWHHSGSDNPHPGHPEMDGDQISLDKEFENPVTGETLRYPRDPLADASETVNCGCYHTIDSVTFKELAK